MNISTNKPTSKTKTLYPKKGSKCTRQFSKVLRLQIFYISEKKFLLTEEF